MVLVGKGILYIYLYIYIYSILSISEVAIYTQLECYYQSVFQMAVLTWVRTWWELVQKTGTSSGTGPPVSDRESRRCRCPIYWQIYMTRQAFCVLRTDDIGAANSRCMRYMPSGDFWSFNCCELGLQLHDGVGTANVKLWTIGGSKEMRQSSGRVGWITSRIWQDLRFFFEAWHFFERWWADAWRQNDI